MENLSKEEYHAINLLLERNKKFRYTSFYTLGGPKNKYATCLICDQKFLLGEENSYGHGDRELVVEHARKHLTDAGLNVFL